jgi:DNA (cytosine-5)-methyltransferase 1
MRCVSLFSGCGGLDLGLKQAGFTTVLAVDNDPRCARSYQHNFPQTPFFLGSVSALTGPRLRQLSHGETARGITLLAGGPPCPPYSKSRFYRTSKPRALADEIGQVTLTGYLETLRLLRPEAFLLENVAGMAYRVHADALRVLVGSAEDLGYHCVWRVLNAADYGVPQIRERFFLVGMRHGVFRFPEPTHAEGPPDNHAGLLRWRSAGEVLADLDTEANADDTGHFAGGRYHDLLVQIPPGDNYLFFTRERGHPQPVFGWRKRYWSYLLKLSPDRPSWTIQARRSNNIGPFHWRSRILRIAEVKRLQTFPDDWYLAGTVEQQWRQVGNAVPPLLAYQLGKALHEQLLGCQAAQNGRAGQDPRCRLAVPLPGGLSEGAPAARGSRKGLPSRPGARGRTGCQELSPAGAGTGPGIDFPPTSAIARRGSEPERQSDGDSDGRPRAPI